MMNFLKNHPFAVEAFFESSLVLSFAVPADEIRGLLPPCLELDVFADRWAFVAVAMVATRDLRPKGFPRVLGNDFFLIGYRVFVRFTNRAGKRLRGLYILKSETDKKKMEFFGNIFTHYNYTTTDIERREEGGVLSIGSRRSGFRLRVEVPGAGSADAELASAITGAPGAAPEGLIRGGEAGGGGASAAGVVATGGSDGERIALPAGSPFADWAAARRYAGPLPFTFTYDAARREVLIIEGVRENWRPEPVRVMDQQFAFINGLGLSEARLANAFIIRNIPYYWKKGKIEPWMSKEEISRVS